MNPMFQARVTKKTARKFIDYMKSCGFEARKEGEHYTFWKNCGVNVNYTVYISENSREAFLGTRVPG